MNLGQLLTGIVALSDEECIFARKPWNSTSEAIVAKLTEDFRVPASVSTTGLEYFLEVSVCQEVLEVFGDKPATNEEKQRLLIFYAENDAYPEWVYNR
jgi:hypothetical protein